MPSLDLARLANVNKSGQDQQGKNKGKLTIKFANKTKTGWQRRPKFSAYQDAFHLLK
jgi:hypothetical protein